MYILSNSYLRLDFKSLNSVTVPMDVWMQLLCFIGEALFYCEGNNYIYYGGGIVVRNLVRKKMTFSAEGAHMMKRCIV